MVLGHTGRPLHGGGSCVLGPKNSRIEECPRVMKSGCEILEHQNRDATVLLRAIARDAVIAWRIMLLALLGRTAPGLPAVLVFDASEGEVRQLLTSKKTLRG